MFNQQAVQDLSSLHDIHLPNAIGWWPLAPGWYLLIVSCFLTFFVIGLICFRYYVNGRARRTALRTLANYQQQYQNDGNSQLCTSRISELLKRVALAYYPRKRVASLHGDAWITFLNSTAKSVNFNAVRMQLLDLPWRPSKNQSLDALFKTARKWIMRQRKPCSN